MTQVQAVRSLSDAEEALPGPVGMWIEVVELVATVLGLAALVFLYGFVRYQRETGLGIPVAGPVPAAALSGMLYMAVAGFLIAFGSRLFFLPRRKVFLRDHWFELIASVAVLAAPVFVGADQSLSLNHVLAIYLIFQFFTRFARMGGRFIETAATSPQAIAGGFLTLIVAGALLLSLPAAGYADRFADFGNNFSDHLFTATSAVCLTGLSVRDVATDYTPFGQLVIGVLMQLGGLGIMTFGTVLFLQLGLSAKPDGDSTRRILRVVVLVTLALELLGAVLLYPMWDAPNSGSRAFQSAFHAVSAFCNGGFALASDSLVHYAHRWQVYGVVTPLIVLGGLGIPALLAIGRDLLRSRSDSCPPADPTSPLHVLRPDLHIKVVLVSTFVLIAAGAAVILALERPQEQHRWGRSVQYEDVAIQTDTGVLRNHGLRQRLLDAAFLSVTARTGGLTTVDTTTGKLHPATLVVLASLMAVGGSPASAAGGIKTVTLAILVAAVAAGLRRRPDVVLFGRRIDPGTIRRAVLVVLVSLTGIWLLAFALVLVHPQIGYLDLLFEAVSACSNTGLSTGITPHLSLAGRILIMLGMFAGRLGPLTLLWMMADDSPGPTGDPSREVLMTG